jgi:iron-sulfur cluster repair protein YtfE (RIC family)
VPAVASTSVNDRGTWVALRDRWARFAHVLHGHHSLEDAELWPCLQTAVTAAADVEAQGVLDAMAAEHSEIDPLLAGVADGLDRMIAAPSLDARAALAVRMVAARDSLDRHMAHEEQSALPLVQRYLTLQDWAAMEAASPKGKPGELAFIVPWVLHEMPTHAMPRVKGFGGPVLIGLGRLFRRSFERKERRAFGQ